MLPHRTTATTALLLLLSLTVSGAEVRLKESVQSQGSLVLLGDVADVRHRDPSVVRQLQRIELFPAPTKRQARTLRIREVRELMRLYGVDVSACRFSGADACRIHSQPSERPFIAPGARPRQPVATAERRAASTATDTVVVAVRPLRRGQIVTAADVALQTITAAAHKIAGMRGRAIVKQLSDVVGLELTRSVNADQPIDARALRRPLMVRRGDVIQVTARAAGVTVRTSARAMENGSHGDLITMQSTENRGQYLARVTGSQQAEVYASGAAASGPAVPQIGSGRPARLPLSQADGGPRRLPLPGAGRANRPSGVGQLPKQQTGWRPASYRPPTRNQAG